MGARRRRLGGRVPRRVGAAHHGMLGVIVSLPLIGGVMTLITLVVHQYRRPENPPMPMRKIATTFPVACIVDAAPAGVRRGGA